MTRERYKELMDDAMSQNDVDSNLTQEEMKQGYHFCYEWDGLLVGPDDDEMTVCSCLPKDHALYKRKQEFINNQDEPISIDELDKSV